MLCIPQNSHLHRKYDAKLHSTTANWYRKYDAPDIDGQYDTLNCIVFTMHVIEHTSFDLSSVFQIIMVCRPFNMYL